MILYSIIIPHYNSVQYLERLLDTIPQKETIQLIVVDDKSDENLESVKEKVLLRGGRFLHNTTEKKGAGVCRNIGLQEAEGRWLVFADADDYFVEGAFDIIDRYKDSTADIVYFIPTSRYNETDMVADRHVDYERVARNYQKNPSRYNEVALRYKFVVPWSKMMKTEVAQKNQILFDEIPAANDVMFCTKYAHYAKEIEVSDECIYCVTRMQGTLTTKFNEKNFWARVQVYKDRYVFLNQHLKPDEVNGFGVSKRCGMSVIIKALRQGYGLKMALRVYRYFRENKIKLVDFKSIGTSVYRKIKL